jgi:small subunit ribosomal protein S5
MAFNKKFGKNKGRREDGAEKDFEQKLLDLARVTRVTKGGKRMNFRATIVLGDKKGQVGFGIAKAADVSQAIDKATRAAKKRMITLIIKDETIPHVVYAKFGSGKVLMKPAAPGKGVKAGGAMRVILELAGVPNVTGKILGSNNKINVLYATFEALKQLRK